VRTEAVPSHVVTATTVTAVPSSSTYGQVVTLQATVSPASGSTIPSGTVQLRVDGSNVGGPVALSGGKASTTISALNVGTRSITAVYSGDATHNSSTSGAVSHLVNTRNLSGVSVVVTGSTAFTGAQLKPAFSVTDGTVAISTSDYTAAYGANVNVSSGGTITLTGRGNYSGTKKVSFAITKGKGATARTPALEKRTASAITIKASTISGANPGAQTVEYAISKTKTAPTSGWQSSRTFSGRTSYTSYYVFARSKASANCTAGTPSAPLAVKTLKSNNAYLKSLKKNTGAFSKPFAKSRYSYVLKISRTKPSVTITAAKAHAGAKLQFKVGGKWKTVDKLKVSLKRGQTKTVTMRVVAQDGKTIKTYKVKVTRNK